MNNLAYTWYDQGRRGDALDLMQRCSRLRRQVLGPDHPYTVSTLSALIEWLQASDGPDDNTSALEAAGASGHSGYQPNFGLASQLYPGARS